MHMTHNFAIPSVGSAVERLTMVVKYGGGAMDSEADAALAAELADLRAAGHATVVVHGGGPEIDAELLRRGVSTRRIAGLRVTDAKTLTVAESVLCASANKRLVRACQRAGLPAVGISGQDAGLLRARRADENLGFVGEIISCDPRVLFALLNANYAPVVAPIAIAQDASCAYNVNADTAAGAIAAALRADAYVVLTNVPRVLRNPRDPSSDIARLTVAQASAFAQSIACESGMKPKVLAAVHAVTHGAARAYIGAAGRDAIAGALAGNATLIA